jgi:hypothetical protein
VTAKLHSGPNPTTRRTADAQHDEAKASGQQGVIILAFTMGTNGEKKGPDTRHLFRHGIAAIGIRR